MSGYLRSFITRGDIAVLILSMAAMTGCRPPIKGADRVQIADDGIDVGRTALLLGREIEPAIDVDAYSARIDDLAAQVRELNGGSPDPDRRIRALNTVLYQQAGFRADRNLSLQRKPEQYHLHHVLETKQGNCLSLPILYVAVAQRLDWPVHLVHVPDHTFVRYVARSFGEANIETTSGGGFVSDDRYARDFRVSDTGLESGAYLRALTHRESLGDLHEINAITLGRRGRLLEAIEHFDRAVQYNPRLVTAWANLAAAHAMMAKRSSGSVAARHRHLALACRRRRDALGFVHPKDVPQFASRWRDP